MTKLSYKSILLALVIFIALSLLVIFDRNQERSAAYFCGELISGDTQLASKNGDTYRYTFLENGSSDISDLVEVMKDLENSAPDEIREDVKTLREIAETIEKDPSQAAAAGLSGIAQEDNVQNYINQNCSQS